MKAPRFQMQDRALAVVIRGALYGVLASAVVLTLFALAGCTHDELTGMQRDMRVRDANCKLSHDVYAEALANGNEPYAERAKNLAAGLGCPIQ